MTPHVIVWVGVPLVLLSIKFNLLIKKTMSLIVYLLPILRGYVGQGHKGGRADSKGFLI